MLLKDVRDLLDKTLAIYVDDEEVVFPQMPDDDEDDILMRIDISYGNIVFKKADNENVEIDEFGALELKATNGHKYLILPLTKAPVLRENMTLSEADELASDTFIAAKEAVKLHVEAVVKQAALEGVGEDIVGERLAANKESVDEVWGI